MSDFITNTIRSTILKLRKKTENSTITYSPTDSYNEALYDVLDALGIDYHYDME